MLPVLLKIGPLTVYSFGAMLYALTLGVDLTDKDFDAKTGIPKNFIARFPDLGRWRRRSKGNSRRLAGESRAISS